MKILIYSEGRVGSHSLGQWLSDELSIPFYQEMVEINYNVSKDFIQKIYHFKQNKTVDFNFFDKIIVLYRENILENAISNIYALKTKKYHHSSNDILDGYYSITKEFCDENYIKIIELMTTIKESNKELKKLDKFLILSYEEIFIDNVGQQKIENYIGFESKSILANPKLKLRKIDEETSLYLENLIEKNKKKLI